MRKILLAACFCFPNNFSKKYISNKEYFWGQKTSYTCEYECQKGEQKIVIVGTHHKTIIGPEKGNEIICDGTVYEERYSAVTNWFVWTYIKSVWFDGTKSNSPEIKEHCSGI